MRKVPGEGGSELRKVLFGAHLMGSKIPFLETL